MTPSPLQAAPELNGTARHVRMLTTLMAGCDPCGWVDQGGSPNLYVEASREVLVALQHRADVTAVVMTLPGEADVEPAMTFARVAVDWWRTADVARPPLAACARGSG